MMWGCRIRWAVAVLALGIASGAAYGGVFNTKHNLSARGVGAVSNFSGTKEICVFCHTPHGADSSAATTPPASASASMVWRIVGLTPPIVLFPS